MKSKLTFLAFILINLSFLAQNIQVEIFPPTSECLPCMAMDWEVTVTNAGDKDIWLVAENLKQGIKMDIPEYVKENGNTMNCSRSLYDPSTPIIMEPDKDASIKHKVLFKVGESVKVLLNDYPGIYCPIDRDISGLWNGKVAITLNVAEGDYVRDIKKLVVYGKFNIVLTKISNSDLAAVKEVWDEAIKAEPKYEIKEGRPTWFDYLLCPPPVVEKVLFQKYPQSSYTGDFLLNYGSSGSLTEISRMTKEGFDKYYCIVGSAVDMEKRRDMIKQANNDYITKARTFLTFKTDLCREDSMRYQMAIALFYTDKPQEAWLEVEKLSKMNSIHAKEAKALLADRMKYQVDSPQKTVK